MSLKFFQMTFNEDYAEDYSLPFQDLQNDSSNIHPSEDSSHVAANNQTVMAACGLEWTIFRNNIVFCVIKKQLQVFLKLIQSN